MSKSGSRRLLIGLALLCLLAANLPAQGIYATLTGVVSDPSSAVVAAAKVTLKDAQSGSQRTTVTNNDGYFTFASVPVGTYELTVEAKGFNTYKVTGIALGGGEKRNVDVTLQVGSTSTEVNVTGGVEAHRSRRLRREVVDSDHQRTAELRGDRQQRRRVHQDHAGIRHSERHLEQVELYR